MTGIKKGREGKLGARPRGREKRGEERVSLPPFSRAQHPFSFCSFRNASHAGYIISQTVGKKIMFLLVTLRFLSNPSISLIASLLNFFHVSAVCFNVTLKLSTGAHNPERATSMRSCHGVFTDQFIFRTVLTQMLNIF